MNYMGTVFMPHPPIAVPEVGKGQEEKISDTIEGFIKGTKEIAKWNPDVIVLVSPHGNAFSDSLSVIDVETLSGSLSRFGFSKPYNKKIYKELKKPLQNKWLKEGTPHIFIGELESKQYRLDLQLDHGALVPIYYIDKELQDYKLVHITPGFISPLELYNAGKLMTEVLEELDVKYAVVASADLSHCLKDSGPYEYHPDGKKFDSKIKEHFENNEPERIFDIPAKIINNAGQCGYGSYSFALGMSNKFETEIEVFSYEGTFGVGYLNAVERNIGYAKTERQTKIDDILNKNYHKKKSNESSYVKLARKAIEEHIRNNRKPSWDILKDEFDRDFVTEVEDNKTGTFVTIEKEGKLRGCIGTTEATKDNLAKEIISNAISAAARDPRFPKVSEKELESLDIKVDVLGEIEKVETKEDLDIKRYGVVVKKGVRKGLLLPDLEGVKDVDHQINIARQKAGLLGNEKYELYRFEVKRYH